MKKKILVGIAIVIVLAIGLILFLIRPVLSLDLNNLPKFVTKDAVTLSNYIGISKFRSGAGHSYAAGGESCRSMKHYFLPKKQTRLDNPPTSIDPSSNIPVYSPVDGVITKIVGEQYPLGKQWHIKPDGYPAYSVILFHVYPLDNIKSGMKVKAGDRIGSVLPTQQMDIAVNVRTVTGEVLLSYFDVMSDEVLNQYKARGITSKNDLIISKEQRDKEPLECEGKEKFKTQSQEGTSQDWVNLK